MNARPNICSSQRHNSYGEHGIEFSSLHTEAGCYIFLQIRQYTDRMAKRNHQTTSEFKAQFMQLTHQENKAAGELPDSNTV